MLELKCPVRGCGAAFPVHAPPGRAPDGRRPGALRCPRGHCFDVSRSGYVNLLQPQERRSARPGDPAAAVAARRRLCDAGAAAALLEALGRAIAGLGLRPGARALDVGCGEGTILGTLAARRGLEGVGIDISTRAVELAARRNPELLWLVANADRALPLAAASVDLVLSVDARRNPAECARVLAPGGHLLLAVPAEDDLAELRAAALGRADRRERVSALAAEHAPAFVVAGRAAARERRRFAGPLLEDLLTATYRGGRAGRRERVADLDGLEVTLSHEILVLERAPAAGGNHFA